MAVVVECYFAPRSPGRREGEGKDERKGKRKAEGRR